jgi:hypothetical protein
MKQSLFKVMPERPSKKNLPSENIKFKTVLFIQKESINKKRKVRIRK